MVNYDLLWELRIRLKLIELRKFEEKSEQQANIIKSGQVDLWLEEHHQEKSELLEELENQRSLISQQAGLLAEIEKKKVDRIIINQPEVLERQLRILKKQTKDNLDSLSKISQFKAKLQKDLISEQESYSLLTNDQDSKIEHLFENDFKSNEEQYWKLMRKRDLVNQQISGLQNTVQK